MLLVADLAETLAAVLPDGPVADELPRLHATDALRSQTRLSRAISKQPEPALLMLDDVHHLRGALTSLDVVVSLVDHLPPGWSVALAQRASVDLPVARWRLAGRVLTLGYEDLAFDASECRAVLTSLGVTVTDALVRDTRDRTEGWPAGVYLSALALRSDRPQRAGPLVAGDDVHVRSYLDSEILAHIEPADLHLLVQTSILDEISGSLAEAITGDAAAGERLYRIAGQNLLVSAVDHRQRWFRCHSLLRERLQRDLEDAAGQARASHARASAWYEQHGRLTDAVSHAFLSGEMDRAERLVAGALQGEYRAGRIETLRSWLDRFEPAALARMPQLALGATLFAALEGDAPAAARWAAIARLDHADDDDREPVPDGLDPWLVRALLGADGPERMLQDARRSVALHDEAWRYRPVALMVLGGAQLLGQDTDAAMATFEDLERAPATTGALARLPARAERALHAMGRRSWSEAEQILVVDRQEVLGHPDAGRVGGTLWLIADARMSLHRGDVRGAQDRLRRAQVGRPRLTWAMPWYGVRTLTVLAQTQLQLSDPAGARASLAQALEDRPGPTGPRHAGGRGRRGRRAGPPRT